MPDTDVTGAPTMSADPPPPEWMPLPDGPFLTLMRLDGDAIVPSLRAFLDALQARILSMRPDAGPMIVLHPDADLSTLADDDLARLGLQRIRDTPGTGVDG